MSPASAPRCFLHIPKSAGTSVHIGLEKALPPGSVSPKRQDASLLSAGFSADRLDPGTRAVLAINDDEIAQLSGFSVVSGHFCLSTLRRITEPSSVATVLREPRTRLLSHYAFWRLSSEVRTTWRGFPALDYALRPLGEFLAEPRIAENTDNLLCRMLLRGDGPIPDAGFIPAADVADVAAKAIAALDTLGFVGVLELGDSFWQGLSAFFQVALTPSRLNTADSHSPSSTAPAAEFEITSRILDLLEARTAADAILYRHALTKAGCSAEEADRTAATAFANELFRAGNLVGMAATHLRRHLQEVGRLQQELAARDADIAERREEITRLKLELEAREGEARRAEEDLLLHRTWLEGIQASASWRLTAPARAAKRGLKGLRASRRTR